MRNRRAWYFALVFCAACTVTAASHAKSPQGFPQFPEAGPTPDPANWTPGGTGGAGTLSVIDHHLSYTTTGTPTASDFDVLSWNHYVNDPDWTFPLNVSMPMLPNALAPNQFVQYGMQAMAPAGGGSFSLFIEEFNSNGTLTRQFRAVGNGVDQTSDVMSGPNDFSGLRLRFSSASGPAGGLFADVDHTANDGQWTPFAQLASFNLDNIIVFGVSGVLT